MLFYTQKHINLVTCFLGDNILYTDQLTGLQFNTQPLSVCLFVCLLLFSFCSCFCCCCCFCLFFYPTSYGTIFDAIKSLICVVSESSVSWVLFVLSFEYCIDKLTIIN